MVGACLLDLEGARARRDAGQIVSVKRAHACLAKLREQHSASLAATQGGGTAPLAATQGGQRPPRGIAVEVIDLTDGAEIDWQGYVSNRKTDEQLVEAIGPGIWRFELRFLASRDKNTNQFRCDFVALRMDGTAVRFHPGSKWDTIPIIGVLEQWVIAAGPPPSTHMLPHLRPTICTGDATPGPVGSTQPLAATQGPVGGPTSSAAAASFWDAGIFWAAGLGAPAPAMPGGSAPPSSAPAPAAASAAAGPAVAALGDPLAATQWTPPRAHTHVYHYVSQQDAIGQKEARHFLQATVARWAQLRDEHNAGRSSGGYPPLARDLTDQRTFPWHLFLSSTTWGRDIFAQGVGAFWLVWLGNPINEAAFLVTATDGSEVVIQVGRGFDKARAERLVSNVDWTV